MSRRVPFPQNLARIVRIFDLHERIRQMNAKSVITGAGRDQTGLHCSSVCEYVLGLILEELASQHAEPFRHHIVHRPLLPESGGR